MLVDRHLELNKLLGFTRGLSHITRYAGTPVHHRENIAEHAFYAAFFTLAIGKYLSLAGVALDMEKLLEGALVHHIDKVGTGDVARRIKHSNPTLAGEFNRMSKAFVDSIEGTVGIPLLRSQELLPPDSIESRTLYVADLLAVVSYLGDELAMGNSKVVPKIREVREHMNNLSQSLQGPLADVAFQTLMILDAMCPGPM